MCIQNCKICKIEYRGSPKKHFKTKKHKREKELIKKNNYPYCSRCEKNIIRLKFHSHKHHKKNQIISNEIEIEIGKLPSVLKCIINEYLKGEYIIKMNKCIKIFTKNIPKPSYHHGYNYSCGSGLYFRGKMIRYVNLDTNLIFDGKNIIIGKYKKKTIVPFTRLDRLLYREWGFNYENI